MLISPLPTQSETFSDPQPTSTAASNGQSNVDIDSIINMIEEQQHFYGQQSTEMDEEEKSGPRLRSTPRNVTFRHFRGSNLGTRFRFVHACKFPFLNKKFLESLWKTDSLLVILDSQTNVNIVLPQDFDSNRPTQSGLALGSALALIELARPSIVHLKLNVVANFDAKNFAQLGCFLRDANWIHEIRLNVPNMLMQSVYLLLDLIAEKITSYHGPTSYLPQLYGCSSLQTVIATTTFRPANWIKDRGSQSAENECIATVFRTRAQNLKFEISGLFEVFWKHAPLQFNSTVKSIRISDSTMMQKKQLRSPFQLPVDVVENCQRSLKLLKSSVGEECALNFHHRGWLGYPMIQSFTRLTAELISLVHRIRHLSNLARESGLHNFVATLEMDVVLKRHDTRRQLLSSDLVLRSLERTFRCKFDVYRDPQTQQPKSERFVANLTQNSVVVLLDFSHVMDYGYVQHLRLAQLVALPVSLFALYAEADRLGLSGFLLPAVLVCCALYMNAYRYFYQVDGRFDVDCVLNGSFSRVGHAIQAFGPFVLSVLIHFCTPQLPSSSSSLMFNVSHFLVIAAAFCVLILDVLGAMKKRVQ